MRLPSMRPLAVLALLAGALAGPTQAQAQAQDAKALQLKALAATCANCHGTEGRAVEGASVP
jgi:sulfide dehydrogenase cytochrome subunit